MKHKLIVAAFATFLLGGCEDDSYTPKPKGYFRISLPQKNYQTLSQDCPFTFDYPKYSSIMPNKNHPTENCWFNINFDELNASIYLSYKAVNENVNQYIEDSRTLVFKHTVKANDINQEMIQNTDQNVYGLVYHIEGNAASSVQFHLTDSTQHFLRGSLYFNNTPNQDSIQPVLDFIKEDIDQLIQSFEWKN